MNILFVADPLSSFQTYKDTTFAMMRELQRRGHRLAACEPQQLQWQAGGQVSALVRRITLTRRSTANSSTPRTCWNRPSAKARASSTARARCATTLRNWR